MFSNLGISLTMQVTITGILIVFFALILLVAIITVFGKVFEKINNKKNQKAQTEESTSASVSDVVPAPAVQSEQDEELAAVIAAACYVGALEGKTYRVKSVKPASKGRPVWATAGIMKNNRSF